MGRWKTKEWFGQGKYYVLKNSERYGSHRSGQFKVKFFKTRLEAKRFARKLNKRDSLL